MEAITDFESWRGIVRTMFSRILGNLESGRTSWRIHDCFWTDLVRSWKFWGSDLMRLGNDFYIHSEGLWSWNYEEQTKTHLVDGIAVWSSSCFRIWHTAPPQIPKPPAKAPQSRAEKALIWSRTSILGHFHLLNCWISRGPSELHRQLFIQSRSCPA